MTRFAGSLVGMVSSALVACCGGSPESGADATAKRDTGTSDGATVWLYNVEARAYEELIAGDVPVWMNDSRRVLFRDSEGLFAVVDTVSCDLQHLEVPTGERLILSPANDRVYLVQASEEADIWLLEFGER